VISRWAPRAVVAGGLAGNPGAEHATRVSHRFAAPRRSVGFWVALWTAVVATEFVALLPMVVADEPTAGYRVVFRLVGGVFAACGLIAWHRRPDSRSGLLMVATGFGLLVEPVFVQLDPGALRTVGDLFEDAWGIPIIALLLTFLSGGRLASRVDRVLVGVFVLALVIEFARHLVLAREGNFLFVRENAAIAEGLVAASAFLVSVGCIAVAVVIGARWKVASAPRRRAMWPSVAGISCLLFFAIAQQSTPSALQWLAACSLLAVPAAFLAGLLRSRLARGGLAELFRELSGTRGPALQAALARTLGDPTLVLAHRLPDSLGHADADGRPVLVPPVTADRATAPIRHDGEEIAVLVYDALLDDDPELVEAVSAAAAIALENERLHVVSEARLVELKASRERIVTAGDAERRRIERDLHDGAQQRMVAIALQLRLAEGQIHDDPALAEELVKAASTELALSLSELRELARGIHPAVLEHGLSAALDSLALRSAVPTSVSYETSERLPERFEFAAYFVASEALANIAKHAHAEHVKMRVWRSAGMASIEIADDGVGGADDSSGSGLRGLADRVEALNGHLDVRSAPGAGTVVTAEMPCGS
jgi:signal transduction histidine kinase